MAPKVPEPKEIIRIRKSGDNEPHKRIAAIGILHSDGTILAVSQQDAINQVQQGRWIFYAHVDGRNLVVTLGTGSNGERYLTTLEENRIGDLLSLEPC